MMGYQKTLRIAAKKHDLTGIRVFDPMEETLPNLGMVPMVDAETGEYEMDQHLFKARYAECTPYASKC